MNLIFNDTDRDLFFPLVCSVVTHIQRLHNYLDAYIVKFNGTYTADFFKMPKRTTNKVKRQNFKLKKLKLYKMYERKIVCQCVSKGLS